MPLRFKEEGGGEKGDREKGEKWDPLGKRKKVVLLLLGGVGTGCVKGSTKVITRGEEDIPKGEGRRGKKQPGRITPSFPSGAFRDRAEKERRSIKAK